MITDTDEYPSVPHERLMSGGWERRSKREETVFQMPGVEVFGYTLLYSDTRLRATIEDAGAEGLLDGDAKNGDLSIDPDGRTSWRFFFATALSFRPPLPPGIGPVSVRPTVANQARRSFAADLEARGFVSVESGRNQRMRTESGERAWLRKVTARLPVEWDTSPMQIEIEGWLAVWITGGSFRISGGAYPVGGLDVMFERLGESDRSASTSDEFRDELLELIRSVR